MEKKVYGEPVVELIDLAVEDIICISGGDNDGSWDDINSVDI